MVAKTISPNAAHGPHLSNLRSSDEIQTSKNGNGVSLLIDLEKNVTVRVGLSRSASSPARDARRSIFDAEFLSETPTCVGDDLGFGFFYIRIIL